MKYCEDIQDEGETVDLVVWEEMVNWELEEEWVEWVRYIRSTD